MGRAPYLFLGLGIVQAAHSAEEVITPLYEYFPRVSGFLHERVSFIPAIAMGATTFVVLNILIITFILSCASFVFLGRPWALRLAKVVAVIEILNGTGHISAALVSGAYWPGCLSGVGLVTMGTLFLYSGWRERRLRD